MTEKHSNPLFLSIPIPVEISTLLERVREIDPQNKHIRWTPAENFHVTLLYVGRVDAALLPGIRTILSEVAKELSSFELSFETFVFIPANAHPKMLWAQFVENDDYNTCSNRICEALKPLIHVESRFEKLIPHILLARIKERATFDQSSLTLPNRKFNLPVTSWGLWESNQSDRGVYYKKLLMLDFQ